MKNLPDRAFPNNAVEFLDCSIFNSSGVFALRLKRNSRAKRAFFSLIAPGGRKAVISTHLTRTTRLTSHKWVQGEECYGGLYRPPL